MRQIISGFFRAQVGAIRLINKSEKNLVTLSGKDNLYLEVPGLSSGLVELDWPRLVPLLLRPPAAVGLQAVAVAGTTLPSPADLLVL